VDLSHVLWIGGPQGSGKSSIARALADRFGLQLYLVDHRVWVHEPRMPSTEFASLSMDERWVHADARSMVGWFVTTSRHRFRLVLEDLRELPDEPACIVEGPQLFPTNVSAVLRSPDQALFLSPDPDEMAARLRARGPMLGTSDGERARENAVARDLQIAQMIEREARELRLPVLAVDQPLDGMIERAAEHFAPVVERLPRGGDLAAVRAFEAEVRETQIRLYEEELLKRANAEAGTSR
jgi:broad-specificity NMP kinase